MFLKFRFVPVVLLMVCSVVAYADISKSFVSCEYVISCIENSNNGGKDDSAILEEIKNLPEHTRLLAAKFFILLQLEKSGFRFPANFINETSDLLRNYDLKVTNDPELSMSCNVCRGRGLPNCSECKNTGVCWVCGGSGKKKVSRNGYNGFYTSFVNCRTDCLSCERFRKQGIKCHLCKGDGKVINPEFKQEFVSTKAQLMSLLQEHIRKLRPLKDIFYSAVKGDAEAQLKLANVLYTGECMTPDEKEAEKYYQLAAEQDMQEALYELACLYRKRQDFESAYKYMSRAAEQGMPEALYELGLFHLNGLWGKMDKNTALNCFKQAAAKGSSNAMFELGYCYYTGTGAEQDLSLAGEWFQKAADNGDKSAAKMLSLCGRK